MVSYNSINHCNCHKLLWAQMYSFFTILSRYLFASIPDRYSATLSGRCNSYKPQPARKILWIFYQWIIKHFVRPAQLLLLRTRLHVSTLIIGHFQAFLQLSLQMLCMLGSHHVYINKKKHEKFMLVDLYKLNCKKAWRWPIIKVETCSLVRNKSSCAGLTKCFIIHWYTSNTSWYLPSNCEYFVKNIVAWNLFRWAAVDVYNFTQVNTAV
jgi:hypothetical protein